jgi:hypothetical protein
VPGVLLRLVQNVRVNLLCRQHNTKRLNSRGGKEAGLGPGNAVLQVHCVVGEAVDTETGVPSTRTEVSSSVLHMCFIHDILSLAYVLQLQQSLSQS